MFIEMVVTHHLKLDSSKEQVKNLTEVVEVLPYIRLSFFFSIYIYGVKISMFNGHQTVDEGEICSYISRDSMSSFCASSSLSVLGFHTFYQMFITYM